MKVKAYLTIYLALSLTAMLAVVMALLAGIRKNTIRTEAELALDTAGYSTLAEYDRELLEQYDIFFIDTSYDNGYPAIEHIGVHIKDYVDGNLRNTKLIDCGETLIGIQDAEAATDDGGEVFKRQILNYEKEHLGIGTLENLLGKYAGFGENADREAELERKRKENETRLSEETPPVKTVEKERYNEETEETERYTETEEVPIENPAAHINDLRKQGILHLLIEDTSKLSDKEVNTEEYVSNRSGRLQGTGLLPERAEEDGVLSKSLEKPLLDVYIFQKYGYYGKEKEKGALAYQVEYLIGKKGSDIENLKAAANRLLLLREASNVIYLYGNAAKKAEIAAMAAGVSAVALAPYLQPLIETSILFAWAYIESIQDVKLLLAGGKVPIFKSDLDWKTGLASILNFAGESVTKEGTRGLDYAQYLSMALFVENEEKLLFAMMDVMEMDIRKTPYHENFRMDGCVSGFRVAAKFDDGGGGCTFLRTYYY